MKSIGMRRKIDDLGRIVLPIELRRQFDIEPRNEMEIYIEGDKIVLRKYQPACIFCGSSEDLVNYDGKNICKDCVDKINAITD